VHQLTKAGCRKVFREVASGAKTDRGQLRRLLDAGDVVTVTRLDRLARSTRDLPNTLTAITDKKAGFRSLDDASADTTTSHGRLMLTVLGGLTEFERDLIRSRTGEGRNPQRCRARLPRCFPRPGQDLRQAQCGALGLSGKSTQSSYPACHPVPAGPCPLPRAAGLITDARPGFCRCYARAA
jgi:hypothetical protein